MPKFHFRAVSSVTLHATIDADSIEQALEIAGEMSVPRPTAKAYFDGEDGVVWRVDPELSDPSNIEVVE